MPKVTLMLNSEKKHSVRYDYAGEALKPVVRSLYISKPHLPTPFPRFVTVELSFPEEES